MKASSANTTGSMGLRRRVFAVAIALIAIDFATKQLVVDHLEGHRAIRIIGSVVTFDVGRNPGAAFSMGAEGGTILFTAIAATAVVLILIFAPRMVSSIPSPLMLPAVALLLAGAGGNLLDRLMRAPGFGRGWVVDFIRLPHFPIFNVSDMCITASVVFYLLAGVSSGRRDKKHAGGGAHE